MNCLRGKQFPSLINQNIKRINSKRYISVGGKLKEEILFEGSPKNGVSILELLKQDKDSKRSIIVGVPGAFSPGCSEKHIPQYIEKISKINQEVGINKIYVISVNDSFVMKAWKEKFFGESPELNDKFRFLADTNGKFTEKNELSFDARNIFGNYRSKRYSLIVDNEGVVLQSFIEPDNVGINVSSAENVFKNISK
ncbi:peroxiredoxin family protein [Ascoidea rubescens DSM 1968]|uniref:Redoxin n=1 Tax=Ascoidea rubescens DSM 1968 TaxID=1344418 RepID=A0A1D2VJS6_9ASCO|nr:Redoxin [Ascoidea rubescens DSM 1968]ODV61871.1 Redoxin [Ascoidea rubescens DSM 1968]